MQKFIKSFRKAFFAATLLLITGITYGQNWSNTDPITPARSAHTATLLPDGKVLVAGGYDGSNYLNSCALYDPATATWSSTGSMLAGRQNAIATLLQNGKVLVTGGYNGSYLNSCELYDPATGMWSSTGSMLSGRDFHTATLLSNGKVFVTGGKSGAGNNYLNSCELYDPTTATWSSTMPMSTSRSLHTANLLSDGKVLVAGGYNGSYFNSCEIYDPVAATWSSTGPMTTARDAQTATLLSDGKVLVAGGYNGSYLNSCELYDPAAGTWSNTASLSSSREFHTAVPLQNGEQILVTGGYNGSLLSSCELYDAASGIWNSTGSMITARENHTATVLLNGQVLVTGGYNGSYLGSSELYNLGLITWSNTDILISARTAHTATLLQDGKVLVAGGYNGSNYINSCALYNPATATWSGTGSMLDGRQNSTATLLQNGKVLVAGGYNGSYLNTCELYDPVSGAWNSTGSMSSARDFHTATLLPDGKVLVTGGKSAAGDNYLNSCELYDPAAGTWSNTGPMAASRTLHSATLLTNGKVLVAGGYNGSYFSTCEIYDPAAGTWSSTSPMATSRDAQTATLLPGGNVLVAGGYNGGYLNSCELYDPAAGTWSNTGSMINTRNFHTAVLLQRGGQVLVTGGYNGSYLSSSELYDAASGIWNGTGSMITARENHTATVLQNGQVLVTGGYNGDYLGSTELSAYLISKSVIAATSNANGSISPNGLTNVNDGNSQQYTIVPNANYHIADVKIDGVTDSEAINSGTYTFINVTADHTISVRFAVQTYIITTSAGANGSIDAPLTVDYGSDTTVHITPNTGYHVLDVLVDGSSAGAVTSYTFSNVTADHTISATFESSSITYAIKASAGVNGSIAPVGTTNVTWGNSQTYTITPATGFHFAKLVVDGLSVNLADSYTFTNVTAAHTIRATFAINKYTITSGAGVHGTISPKGTFSVNYNGGQTYTITPVSGYRVADVLVDGSSVGAVTTYTFSNVTANHTISATFAVAAYNITSSAGANGSISPNGITAVNYGSSQTYTILANQAYQVGNVVVDGSSVGAVTSYTFTNVAAAHKISASFSCIKPAAPVLSGPTSVTKQQDNLVYSVTNADLGNTFTWTVPSTAQITSGQGTSSITVKWGNASGSVGCIAYSVCSHSTKTIYPVTIGAAFTNISTAEDGTGLTQVSLQVNPNPVQNKAKLVFTISQAAKCSVQLFDLTGKVLAVKEVDANKGVNETTLDVSAFAGGTYFIRFSNGKEKRTVMLVKAK